ncbi:MAG: ABC transporter ATP-binding protein/permease [Clostridiales bacterium]|jgi:ATP-binding cassette subfamily B protein|nr:ABC transporter ATP-binding protein/permease [Clostridiales bacterium]
MKTIFEYIRPKLGVMSFQMLIKFIGTIVELLLPWMLSVILDDLAPVKNVKMIWLWGSLMVICAVIALIFNAMANRMATAISKDITRRVRRDLFIRITALTASQEDHFTTPSLITRLSSDTYNMHQMIDRMQRLGVRAPILMLGGIVLTFSLEPVLTNVLLAALPLLALVIWLVSKYGIRLYMTSQSLLDALIRRAQESMAGIRVIQALSKTDYEAERFEKANKDVTQKERQTDNLMNITSPTMNLLLNTGLTAVVVAGAYRVNAGLTQPGVIIAFLSYFTIILNALMMVSRLFILYSRGVASANRVAEILNAPYEMKIIEMPLNKDDCHIKFNNVSFSYNKVRNNIADISFELRRGETLGIIGPTGSGKSTVLQLLLRFYDADAGEIYLNGKDIRSVPVDVLHNVFGVVFQNDFLYSGEIGENIDFGRGLGKEAVEIAASNAQADFISAYDEKFCARLAPKGANISGGQKQRILLARALAANSEIILLDDSSSALDYKTDAKIREALAHGFSDATKIIVAQRISSIRGADKILVLENGRTAGFGAHDELMEHCESYREIYRIQMGDVV